MAEIKVPKSHAEKLDARALKLQQDYQQLRGTGKGAWQSKQALRKKYKIAMSTVYEALKRAERLSTER